MLCTEVRYSGKKNIPQIAFLGVEGRWYCVCLAAIETRRFVTANAHFESWLTISLFVVFVLIVTIVEKQRWLRYIVEDGIRSLRELPERIWCYKWSFIQNVAGSECLEFVFSQTRQFCFRPDFRWLPCLRFLFFCCEQSRSACSLVTLLCIWKVSVDSFC